MIKTFLNKIGTLIGVLVSTSLIGFISLFIRGGETTLLGNIFNYFFKLQEVLIFDNSDSITVGMICPDIAIHNLFYYGFPFPFLKYFSDSSCGDFQLFLNPLGLLLDIIIFLLFVKIIIKIYRKSMFK